jgi:pre-mRNA-splicing factor ATP-dependent RNA helicase DHX15/PRP43
MSRLRRHDNRSIFNPLGIVNPSNEFKSLLESRQMLPVAKQSDKFLEVFKKNQSMVVSSETGSGKTTQIPQYILHAMDGDGIVACTQPRRLAASSVARRVSREMDVQLGQEVGYKIRFEQKFDSKITRIW